MVWVVCVLLDDDGLCECLVILDIVVVFECLICGDEVGVDYVGCDDV